jgi:flagellar biosynthetic protein FliQ
VRGLDPFEGLRPPHPTPLPNGEREQTEPVAAVVFLLEGVKQMSGAEVLDVARDAVFTLVLVASPLMLIGLVVGVVISLFQALTQIQEMTLVFVPKILAIFIAMLVALPFMADLLQAQMTRLAARIVAMGS